MSDLQRYFLNIYLNNNEGDIVVFLFRKVLNSDNLIFSLLLYFSASHFAENTIENNHYL